MKKEGTNHVFLFALISILLFASMLRPNAGVIVLIVFTPALYALSFTKTENRLAGSLIIGFTQGLLLFKTTVQNDQSALAFLAAVGFGLFVSLYYVITLYLHERHARKRANVIAVSIIVPAVVWALLVELLQTSFIGGYWADFSIFIPYTWLHAFIGSTGVTFLIILTNTVLFHAFSTGRTLTTQSGIRHHIRLWLLLIICIKLFFIIIVGTVAYQVELPEGQYITVAAIQTNYEKSWQWRVEHADGTIITKLEQLTKEASLQQPDIIVWPEYALPVDLTKNEALLYRVAGLAQTVNATLVVGSLTELENTSGHYDVAHVFHNNGTYAGIYKSVSPAFYNGATIPSPDGLQVFTLRDGITFGVTICYEETKPEIMRSYKQQEVDFVVSLSDYIDFKEKGKIISAGFSQIRAIEQDIPLVRASNTGISHIISGKGKVLRKAQSKTEQILISRIKLDHQ